MLLSRTSPRLAPKTLRRPRLERWLRTHAGHAVRSLVAPAGAGKSTLLLQHLDEDDVRGAYLALPREAGTGELLRGVADALSLGKAPTTYLELLVALRQAATTPYVLAIDDADNAGTETAALLIRLVENLPAGVTLIFGSRAREPIAASRWMASGTGALCDARRMAFDYNEIAMLADTWGVAHTHADVARLLEESDGWAIVVSGAIRSAAEDQRSLRDAYERWRAAYGEIFLDFVTDDAERADDRDRALVRSMINGVSVTDGDALRRLEARGLFVVNDGVGVRPLRAIQQSRAVPTTTVETSIPMVVRLLGRFAVTVGGRNVEWVRRRDQQIVKYLLLRNGATAARDELTAVFWPNANRDLATQSLRTACSNIRKAIAGAVGYARVDRYFRAIDKNVVMDLSNVVTDVGLFTAHATAGDAAYTRGDRTEALAHYRAAEKAYAGRLLEEETPQPWFAAHHEALAQRMTTVLERLAEASYAEGDHRHAAEYAYRANLLLPRPARANEPPPA